MDDQKKNKKLLLQIVLAIALGIVVGMFFGEYTAVLKPISDIYIMLLQSVVYPYLIVSLVGGFGRMDTAQTIQLFKKGWVIYLLLILATFFVLFILVAGVPKAQSHIVPLGGNPGVWAQLEESLQLFIPENPFQALVNNAIPAIVVFSILFGLAVQRFKNKESIIVICDCIGRASLQIWNWVVRVAPIGIFALMAFTFGTIVFSDIAALAAYAGLFFFGSLFLTFVLIPLILQAFVPVSYKEFLSSFQSAILISLSTTLSVAAIPFISKMAHSFLKNHPIDPQEKDEVIANSLAISYPICQLGNCFGFLFVFVASAYYHQSLTFAQTIVLSFASFFSSIGSPSATVNSISFLLDLLHLPKAGVNLYVLLLPFTRYAQVLVSITGMAFFTIAISHAYFKKLKFNLTAVILASASACLLLLLGIIFASPLQKISQNVSPNPIHFQLEDELKQGVQASFPQKSLKSQLFSLHDIKNRGVLRVGFNPNMIPWCYYNERNELVGYDVAFMVQLAKDIHVNLEFIPFDWNDLLDNIEQNVFDIAIGSIYVTSNRLEQVGFTRSYGSSVSAFIVRNSVASYFDRIENISQLKPLGIGVFNDPITIPIAKLNFPSQDIITVQDYDNVFENSQVDAVLWTKGHTDAWVTVYNGYTSISPEGLIQGWPQMLAYVVNKENIDFLNFLNDWLDLKKTEGFTEEQEEKWILRNPPKVKIARWSIMRNVLHWTE